MQMLSGEKLGAALTVAMRLKGVGPKEVAEHFGIKPPSVKDWQKRGCVHKKHLGKLVEYFSDVVDPLHWGADPMELMAITSFNSAKLHKVAISDTPDRNFDRTDKGVYGGAFTSSSSSEHNFPLAPLIEWGNLGVDLYRANNEWPDHDLREVPTKKSVSNQVKWIPVIDDALAPKLLPGDLVAIDPLGQPSRDEVALFRTPEGTFILRRWRPLAIDGFEAVDGHGQALDSLRHGITCVGSFVGLFRENV